MAGITKQTLTQRREEQLKREAQIQKVFLKSRAKMRSRRIDRRNKRKEVCQLLDLVTIDDISVKAIREPYSYVPKSYNLERQVTGLLAHMFCRYPVPFFLYRACCREPESWTQREAITDNCSFMKDIYRRWFVTIAQGGSFAKLVKGVLTSREAHLFTLAPAGNRIRDNVWWARLVAAGVPSHTAGFLINRIFQDYFFDDPHGRMAEVINFYARFYKEMDKDSLGEITDFLSAELRRDGNFRLKGRTLGSVTKLSNEWHRMSRSSYGGRYITWNGLATEDHVITKKDKTWDIVQLRNSRELTNEGRKQRHCVWSYAYRCEAGVSYIFSVRAFSRSPQDPRGYEICRVTVEIDSARRLVQARGPLNRLPTKEEAEVIREWAGVKGFVYAASLLRLG
jgi:hypothetical protein